MAVQQLTVSEIVLVKFDIPTKRCTVHIHFKESPAMGYSFTLQEDCKALARQVVRDIKRTKQDLGGFSDDGPLAGYNPVHILNIEELEERLPKGISRILGDVRSFSRMQDAQAYMQARASLQDGQKVLFRY